MARPDLPARDPSVPDVAVTRHPVVVRFGETDLMAIVHHASYFAYIEEARVEYIRKRGVEYVTLTETGTHLPVVDARLRYHKAARFGDRLVVEARLGELTRVTVRFDYRVLRGDEVLCDGYTLLACVGETHRPKRIPEGVAALLRGPETAG